MNQQHQQVVQQTGCANKSDCRRGTRAIDDSGIQISKQSTVYKRISRNVTLDLTQNCSRVNPLLVLIQSRISRRIQDFSTLHSAIPVSLI
ncbi:hypothetical protein O5D80_007660 [Batrachochytrium dendrobatidis]|nr:hypothetical protein O5D80_007660 [Batrachochytrium dendrobatidis]